MPKRRTFRTASRRCAHCGCSILTTSTATTRVANGQDQMIEPVETKILRAGDPILAVRRSPALDAEERPFVEVKSPPRLLPFIPSSPTSGTPTSPWVALIYGMLTSFHDRCVLRLSSVFK